jgi:carbon storage regulator
VLVLSRKNGESLRIGSDVLVRVLVSSRGHVRLGIEAPPDKLVLREELYERIVDANREAASAPVAVDVDRQEERG